MVQHISCFVHPVHFLSNSVSQWCTCKRSVMYMQMISDVHVNNDDDACFLKYLQPHRFQLTNYIGFIKYHMRVTNQTPTGNTIPECLTLSNHAQSLWQWWRHSDVTRQLVGNGLPVMSRDVQCDRQCSIVLKNYWNCLTGPLTGSITRGTSDCCVLAKKRSQEILFMPLWHLWPPDHRWPAYFRMF